MSSDGEDESNSRKEAEKSNNTTRINIDVETQPFDIRKDMETQPLYSDVESPFRDLNGDVDEYQFTEQFNGTIPVEMETQELEDWNGVEDWMTQLLVDETQVLDFADGEESDRTDVLTEADGASDDETGCGGDGGGVGGGGGGGGVGGDGGGVGGGGGGGGEEVEDFGVEPNGVTNEGCNLGKSERGEVGGAGDGGVGGSGGGGDEQGEKVEDFGVERNGVIDEGCSLGKSERGVVGDDGDGGVKEDDVAVEQNGVIDKGHSLGKSERGVGDDDDDDGKNGVKEEDIAMEPIEAIDGSRGFDESKREGEGNDDDDEQGVKEEDVEAERNDAADECCSLGESERGVGDDDDELGEKGKDVSMKPIESIDGSRGFDEFKREGEGNDNDDEQGVKEEDVEAERNDATDECCSLGESERGVGDDDDDDELGDKGKDVSMKPIEAIDRSRGFGESKEEGEGNDDEQGMKVEDIAVEPNDANDECCSLGESERGVGDDDELGEKGKDVSMEPIEAIDGSRGFGESKREAEGNDDDELGEKDLVVPNDATDEGCCLGKSERGEGGEEDDGGGKEKDVAVETNDATDERRSSGKDVSTSIVLDNGIKEINSGSVHRSFMSVRTAALRASGLAAARRMSIERTDTGSGFTQSNSQVRKENICENDGMTDLGDPASVRKERMEIDGDCENGNTETCDKIRNRGAARKLFTDDDADTHVANNEAINDNDSVNGGDMPELDNGHEFAGLSYVNSQVPGELSQANALDIVDKLILVNNVECSQEDKDSPGKTDKGKSPSVPSAKGPRTLACRTNTGSPVGEVGIFDWDDSREDEGGGEFFTKRKDVLFKSNEHGRKSFTQPKKPRRNLRKGKSIVDELGGNEEGLNFHQKIMGSIRSDSRLVIQNLKEGDMTVQIPTTKAKKNLFEKVGEQLNPEPSEQRLEALDFSKSPLEMYDVGVDTQMAAEAMEALLCGVPANNDTADAFQDIQHTRGIMKKRSHSEHASMQKRVSDFDIGGISKRSKRTKTVDNKISGENSISSRLRSKNPTVEEFTLDSALKTNRKKGGSKDKEYSSTINASTRSNNSGRRPSEFARKGREGVVDRAHAEEVDKSHSSSTLNVNISLNKWQSLKDFGASTPVARRTRQSRAVNASEKTTNIFNDSGERKDDLMEVNILGGKRVRSKMGVDASEQLSKRKYCKSGSHLVGDVNKPTLQEPLGPDLPHDKAAKSFNEKRNAMSEPRKKRTYRRVSGRSNGPGNIDVSSTGVDGVVEANGQAITTPNGLNVDVRILLANLDMMRKTRSSTRHPSSCGKNSEGMVEQVVAEPVSAVATVNCSLAVNGKKVIKDLVKEKSSKHSSKKKGVADSVSTPKVVGGNAKLESSPGEKVTPSGSLCVTPINCTTHLNATAPLNEASPLCIGNDYQEPSCKKSLSKPFLVRELNNLCLGSSDAAHSPGSKDLRKRRDITSICVLFSQHLDEHITKQQKKILARLGLSVASSSSEATHFVADQFARTRNMLEAIALGKPVVSPLWLKSCGQANCFVDERNYILRDFKKEKEIGFCMPVSLSRACQRPLLEGKKVFITPNVKPGKEVVAGLVKKVRGQAVERLGRSVMNDDNVLEDLLVLSCEEDYEICLPLLEKGVAIHSSELLLNGIIIQKLEYERHRLFSEHVKRTRSTIWIRKDGDQFIPVTKH